MNAVQLFLRGLFLQSGWNRERMQGLGLTFALLPLAKGRSREEVAALIRRHLDYVNTSPALSGLLLGALVREEERIRADGANAEEAARRVAQAKRQLEGPLAAIGDRIFWGWLRPLSGVAGALILFVANPEAIAGEGLRATKAVVDPAMASIAGTFTFYNGPYLAVRAWATRRGLRAEPGPPGMAPTSVGPVARALSRLGALFEVLGPLAIGALAGTLAVQAGGAAAAGHGQGTGGMAVASEAGVRGAAGVALILSGLLIAAGARRFGQPPERVGIGLLALLILVAGRG